MLLLVTLNLLVHFAEYREVRTLFLLLFIAIHSYCAHHTTSRTLALIESALARVKLRVGEQIAGAELATIERVRAAEICDWLSENTRGLVYACSAEEGGQSFIGPLDLKPSPGEPVFIVGGNGSGKSTLLKVLTGLYGPRGGSLSASGIPI